MVTDRQILETILAKVEGLDNRMDRFEGRMDGIEGRMDRLEGQMSGIENRMDKMEKRQERFEQETRNNFADLRLHLENITDRNISILAENHLNLIDKLNEAIPCANKQLINDLRINSLTDRVTRLEANAIAH